MTNFCAVNTCRCSRTLKRCTSPPLGWLFVWLAIHSTAVAQPVVVDLLQPPPAAMHIEAVWRVNLTNNTGSAIDVRLFGVATETASGRWIANGLSSVYTLEPGFHAIGAADVSPIDYDADPEYDNIVSQTGTVPSGEYTICMYVIHATTNDTLGRDCIEAHVVVNVLPPQLIYPSDNSTVTEPLPVFSWTPASPISIGVEITYDLRVVEVIGRQSSFDALESNPPWFEEQDIPATVLPYSLASEPFEIGTRYAWRIIAKVRTTDGSAGELARSETALFTIGSTEIAPDEDLGSGSGSGVDTGGATIATTLDDSDMESSEDAGSEPDELDDSRVTNASSNRPAPRSTGVGSRPISTSSTPRSTTVVYMAADERPQEPERPDTTLPPTNTYFALQARADAGVYLAVGYLRLVYDNPYAEGEATIRIIDERGHDVLTTPEARKMRPGRNYVTIDLRNDQRLRDQKLYTLLMTGPAGDNGLLRFRFHRCPQCPADHSSGSDED